MHAAQEWMSSDSSFVNVLGNKTEVTERKKARRETGLRKTSVKGLDDSLHLVVFFFLFTSSTNKHFEDVLMDLKRVARL